MAKRRGSKAAAKGLRDAAALMNDGGKHWIQGGWKKVRIYRRKRKDGSTSEKTVAKFCFMGGLCEVFLGDAHKYADRDRFDKLAFFAAVEAAAFQINPSEAERRRERWATQKFTNYTARERRVCLGADYENIIIGFNDHDNRVWDDVEDTLLGAADALERD